MGKRLDEALRMKPFIQKGAQSLEDADALEIKSIYPQWYSNCIYAVGNKVQYMDKLYRCLQAHTAQADWTPAVNASLWTVIDETHAGTYDDPIPYSGNMALEQGKYYSQDGVVYICTRDTVNPVYAALAELVPLYAELANE